jgi:predicted lactoylglutathione lyase
MELGAFSISLTVRNLDASRAFYEKFGFKPFAGDPSKNWLILKNEIQSWLTSTCQRVAREVPSQRRRRPCDLL